MRKRYRSALAGIGVGAVGVILLLLAWHMDRAWADRHFLPSWAFDWEVQLRIVARLRGGVALAGLVVLLAAAPWAACAAASGRGREALGAAARCILAVAAAFIVAELVLHTRTWHSVQDRNSTREPLRFRDPELGWVFAPNQRRDSNFGDRIVHYATGPFGYRAARAGDRPDFERPTIILGGESIMFGYGLDWPDTIGARLQVLTGVQTATIAVDAYGTDQAMWRLRRELPRFAHPVVVVVPFLPRLLDRSLDRDRPHLDSSLRWHPGRGPSFRLVELGRRMIRYRSTQAMAEGIAMTRASLAESMRLSEGAGARPIIVVPQFLPESGRERAIRIAVLDRAGLPYTLVPLPPEWRFPKDGHPNPRGAQAIALALYRVIGRQ